MDPKKQIEYISEQMFVKGNLEVVNSSFSESYVAHDGDKTYKGIPFVKQFIKRLRSTFPDLAIVKIEFLSQSGETVTWQRTLQGTQKAGMQGIPASNKIVRWNEMVVTRFDGEKIAEDWLVSNLAFELMLKM